MQPLGHDNALITLWVSSPDTHSERRFALDLTIADLKVSQLEPEAQHASRRVSG
ncbi:BQ5605_C001g00334 [Microbotryum silenes-dioicae]|uniref:BQ5605_C001g00334 protein n=1 Tax=Microbotryum silenes-dioicae TaxID=796604 RepID=A0A2X0MXG1_9BASI|nr:BQ5605_C001g00334 [Microbotryum silenes-dioicae]